MRVNRQSHVHGCHCCQCDRAISHALTRVPLSNGRSRQVVQLKALLERAEARAASSQEAPCYPAATTPTKQSQSAQHHASPAQLRDAPADHNSSTPQKYNSNAEMPPHPHEICDLDIQGAMQVSEDSPPGGGSGKHTEYAVRVKLWCGLAYSVSRRYNAFFALDQQLQKAFPRVMLPELPPRSLFLSSILDQMDSRCAALNRYVKVISHMLVFESHVHIQSDVFRSSGASARPSGHFLCCAKVFGIGFRAAGLQFYTAPHHTNSQLPFLFLQFDGLADSQCCGPSIL